MIRNWRRDGVALLAVLTMAGCTITGTAQSSPSRVSPQSAAIVYAVIGASDGVGVGAADPQRDAWPQVFFRTALPESTVMYNLSIPGATVASALEGELSEALLVEPTLVTVWLNVNDIVAGVSPSEYEAEFDQLVSALRRGGAAQVLVANTPYLDRLPAYLGCRVGTPPPGVTCPPALKHTQPSDLNAEVDAYNSAIARVVQREHAILVDLHAQGEVPNDHPDWVGSDGFHPSTSGYVSIAAVFAAALSQAGKTAA